MRARNNSFGRRIRSTGGRLLRRLHLLPGGQPDGLGDDDQLAGTVLDGQVMVYFPDTPDSLYQLRGWYGPLRELHRAMGVTVICMDSRVAASIREELGVPVYTVARDATLSALIARGDIKLILYVNYNPLNTAALQARSAIHVSLLHGDSDKGVSVSNQVKAYDFSFVAGQAAMDRFARYTTLFDASERCIPIGRPSFDTDRRDADASGAASPGTDTRPTVLYAPTWEGGQAAVAYSSLPTHGPRIVRSLIAEGMRVIYRPHPLTGVRIPSFGSADVTVRELLAAPEHRISTGSSLWADFAEADLLICDVSAVANDWLATGKPLVVTVPTEDQARDAGTELLDVVPRLSAAAAGSAGTVAREQITVDPHGEERRALTAYYLGDTSPGASLARFLDACRELAEMRDQLWARVRANEREAAEGDVHERG